MRSAASEVDAPCVEFNEEQDVEGFEAERFDGEEITGQELIFVVTHEVLPAGRAAAFWCG